MKFCPVCNGKTSVTNSRTYATSFVRRRRICDECKFGFSTLEIPAEAAVHLARLINVSEELKPLAFARANSDSH